MEEAAQTLPKGNLDITVGKSIINNWGLEDFLNFQGLSYNCGSIFFPTALLPNYILVKGEFILKHGLCFVC